MVMRLIQILLILLPLAGCQAKGVYHTVREGQTLYRISKVYRVDEKYLARINGVGDPTELPVGKRLFIPGADRIKEVSTPTRSAAKPPPPRRPAAPKASSAKAVIHPKATLTKKSAPEPAPPESSEKPDFRWPVKGKIVKRFYPTGNDPCKGVEIAATPGSEVVAVEAGRVIFSGDGISGYGNLIIIRHDPPYITVYGYNKTNFVREGDFVSRGERIGLSGTPPGGGEPRLHFEVRKGKTPVDPTFYLP